MGKGDIKTRKGKINAGSYGKTRTKKKTSSSASKSTRPKAKTEQKSSTTTKTKTSTAKQKVAPKKSTAKKTTDKYNFVNQNSRIETIVKTNLKFSTSHYQSKAQVLPLHNRELEQKYLASLFHLP